MTRPERPTDSQTLAIPHTINVIGDALIGAKRFAFFAQVLAAVEKDVPAVMRRWWKAAMLDTARGAERGRVNTAAGHNFVSVKDLATHLDERARRSATGARTRSSSRPAALPNS